MPFTAQILNIEVDKTSSTSTTLDKQFDWVIECKFDEPIKPITAIQVNGGSGGDCWQAPFNGFNWIIAPYKVDDQTLRLYFSKSQDQTKFAVFIEYNDGQVERSFIIKAGDTTNGLPTTIPSFLVPKLPKEISDTYKSMSWDDRGTLRGIRINNYWMHGSKHVLDALGYAKNPSPENIAADGDYIVFQVNEDVGSDSVCTDLPPIGTKVWQISGRGQIVRTSRISNYFGSIDIYDTDKTRVKSTAARLLAAGPYPGSPVGGDSGSPCFYFDEKDKKVKILGICGYLGSCFIALPLRWPSKWTQNLDKRPNLTFGGSIYSPTSTDTNYVTDNDWYAGMTVNSTILNIPMDNQTTPTPAPVPPTTKLSGVILKSNSDFVGIGNSMSPNGKVDNCVKLFNVSKSYKTIRITGVNGDTWEAPYNPTGYWIIRVVQDDSTTLTCYFDPSNPTTSFNVTVTYTDGTIERCVALPGTEPEPLVVEPIPPTVEPEPTVVKPTPECDCDKLQSDLDKYKKAIDDIKAIVNSL